MFYCCLNYTYFKKIFVLLLLKEVSNCTNYNKILKV